MNDSFTALLKSKGYNKKSLAETCGLPAPVISQRINGRSPWQWKEVGRVCEALGITYDDFAAYFPDEKIRVRPAARQVTREEQIDAALGALRALLI